MFEDAEKHLPELLAKKDKPSIDVAPSIAYLRQIIEPIENGFLYRLKTVLVLDWKDVTKTIGSCSRQLLGLDVRFGRKTEISLKQVSLFARPARSKFI